MLHPPTAEAAAHLLLLGPLGGAQRCSALFEVRHPLLERAKSVAETVDRLRELFEGGRGRGLFICHGATLTRSPRAAEPRVHGRASMELRGTVRVLADEVADCGDEPGAALPWARGPVAGGTGSSLRSDLCGHGRQGDRQEPQQGGPPRQSRARGRRAGRARWWCRCPGSVRCRAQAPRSPCRSRRGS